MARSKNTGVSWHNYFELFREYAHQLLVWGYQDARPQIVRDLEETEITGFIATAMQARINSNPNTPEVYWRFVVIENRPISAEGRTGKRRLMPDIIIESTERIPHPIYVFEAKRLRKRSHPVTNYTGEEGLWMFINDKYAAEYLEAAMIGYVQSDTSGIWATVMTKHFENDSTGQYCLEGDIS